MQDKHYSKICVPIMAKTTKEALIRMEEGFRQVGLLELRIDGLQKINLKKLLAHKNGEILVTNRVKEEGGAFAGPEEERVGFLMEAVALGADYVDLEARTDRPYLIKLREKIDALQGHTRWIVSTHYFDGTPSLEALKKKVDEGAGAGADIIKVVSLARTMEDNLKVFRLIPYARKMGKPIITFCMGEKGKISRILAPLLGALWTYAALAEGQESAPGQMTVGEMKQMFRMLVPQVPEGHSEA
jgi:3-dehydroquinate dehydratase type I